MAKLTPAQLKRMVIDEILRGAATLKINVRELTPDEIDAIRGELSDRFGDGEHLLTFETMQNRESIQNEHGWKLLEDFLGPGPHVMFYESPGDKDRSGVEVADGRTIPKLLGECFGFSFYVTDEGRTFVVGENDHLYLIGVGAAAPWIASMKGKHSGAQ